MTNSAFGKQIQNRNFLSGVAFKFNLTKFPKVDFFSNSARIPELNLELTTQPSYLKNIMKLLIVRRGAYLFLMRLLILTDQIKLL